MKAPAITLPCHSKINLGLRVLGIREDGYHEIRTILHTVSLHDTLEVWRSRHLSLEIREEWVAGGRWEVPTDESNLVLKAAAALRRHLGGRGAAFRLTKRTPPGSGMGAASSDGAAALLALNRMHRLGLDAAEFHRAAAALGSDVPFFLYGGACLSLGRGEEVYPLPDGPDLHLNLVFSPEGLGTPEVYRRWDGLLTTQDKASRMNDFAPWCLVLRGETPGVANDLERAALRMRPALQKVRSALIESGAMAVSMTGSGSAFFGLYGGSKAAGRGLSLLRREGHEAVSAVSLGRGRWEQAVRTGVRDRAGQGPNEEFRKWK